MFKLTPEAASQIRHSTGSEQNAGLALRIAAARNPDGGIEYRIGFDAIGEGDVHLNLEGVDVVIARGDKELLNGTTMDYVEIEPGDFRFIFLNPNDPSFRPPVDP